MEPSDLSLLAFLDALLQEESVTRAARRLSLSTPAMSHALKRVQQKLGDPILVRAGRGMTMTPRARELRPRVHALLAECEQLLAPTSALDLATLERTFVVHATDYVLALLGALVDRRLTDEAPRVVLRFVPNTLDDVTRLREGDSDLAIGIYGELPPEVRTRRLLTDRFVCVMRQGHPLATKRLTRERYVAATHVQVAPRGQPGGYVDDVLRAAGETRRVVRAVPTFASALELAARSDHVLTISERIARRSAEPLGLTTRELPLTLRPYALSLVWHPRHDGDQAHRYLREVLVDAAEAVAADTHEGARTKLDDTDPTTGRVRRGPKHLNKKKQ